MAVVRYVIEQNLIDRFPLLRRLRSHHYTTIIRLLCLDRYMTTGRLMRRFKPTSLRRAQLLPQHQRPCLIHLDRAHPHQQQRNLANLHDKDSRYSEVWFSGTSPTCQVPTEGPGSGLDHPPPDERKLKLGKSTSFYINPTLPATNDCSHSNSTRTSPHPSCITVTSGNSIASNHPTTLPLYAPTSPNSHRSNRIHSCSMDITCRLGSRPSSRQHPIDYHLRKNGQERCIPELWR